MTPENKQEDPVNPFHIAVLIIHGVGTQKPFETLDFFARGLIDKINELLPGGGRDLTQPEIEHFQISGGSSDDAWNRSVLRIRYRDRNLAIIDLHEYYWAHLVAETSNWPKMREWLKKTSENASAFYEANKENVQKKRKASENENDPCPGALFQGDLFKPNGYVKTFASLSRFVPGALEWLYQWASKNPFLDLVAEKLQKQTVGMLLPTLGTVVTYSTTDPKDPSYLTRETIVRNASARLKQLIRKRDASEPNSSTTYDEVDYDHVLVAGHSLGSVVAVDTLNRLHREVTDRNVDYKKIKGLFTFGSPLDKFAFFFRDFSDPNAHLRSQLICQLNSYLADPAAHQNQAASISDNKTITIQDRLKKNLPELADGYPDLLWLNFYGCEDPISGHLDFYRGVRNIHLKEMTTRKMSALEAHSSYWGDREMYKMAINALHEKGLLFRNSPGSPAPVPNQNFADENRDKMPNPSSF